MRSHNTSHAQDSSRAWPVALQSPRYQSRVLREQSSRLHPAGLLELWMTMVETALLAQEPSWHVAQKGMQLLVRLAM